MNEKFEMHCIVEIFGHAQIAGKVSEQTIAGQGFIRVDVPKTTKRDGFTRFYGPSAIYSMTPVSEEIAGLMAERLEVQAVIEWQVSEAVRKLLPSATTGIVPDHEDWDSSSEWPDNDDDTPFFGTMPDGDEPVPDVRAIPDPAISEAAVEQVLTELQADEIEGWHDEESEDHQQADKRAAAQWARELLKTPFVIFDTETTGTEFDDEIIQIGIINQAGDVVLDQLIKPTKSITNTAFHGLTDESVKDAPGFPAVYEEIRSAFNGRDVVAYNYEYDSRMLAQVCQKHGLKVLIPKAHCAMNQYAAFNGEWNDYHGNYRWKKLREALAAFGLKHEDFGTKAHDACTDARATLAVIKKMAEFEADKAVAAESAS